MYHRIYPFNVYNSVFLIYSQLCSHCHNLILGNFHLPKISPFPSRQSSHPRPRVQPTTNLLAVTVELRILDILCKWTRKWLYVCLPLWLHFSRVSSLIFLTIPLFSGSAASPMWEASTIVFPYWCEFPLKTHFTSSPHSNAACCCSDKLRLPFFQHFPRKLASGSLWKATCLSVGWDTETSLIYKGFLDLRSIPWASQAWASPENHWAPFGVHQAFV